jgi:hypothetical protein
VVENQVSQTDGRDGLLTLKLCLPYTFSGPGVSDSFHAVTAAVKRT